VPNQKNQHQQQPPGDSAARSSGLQTRRRRRRRCGFLSLEVLASIGLTVVLATLFASAVLQYAAARRETDTRRLLQLAAAAELDRIRAGLRPIPFGETSQSPASQPGEVRIWSTAVEGKSEWQGLTRVRVVASKRINSRRTIQVELVTFVDRGPQP
jgi:type II secretory pathway pseudopilin PulG